MIFEPQELDSYPQTISEIVDHYVKNAPGAEVAYDEAIIGEEAACPIRAAVRLPNDISSEEVSAIKEQLVLSLGLNLAALAVAGDTERDEEHPEFKTLNLFDGVLARGVPTKFLIAFEPKVVVEPHEDDDGKVRSRTYSLIAWIAAEGDLCVEQVDKTT